MAAKESESDVAYFIFDTGDHLSSTQDLSLFALKLTFNNEGYVGETGDSET